MQAGHEANDCFKKTWTKYSNVLLLHFVPVFLKQMLHMFQVEISIFLLYHIIVRPTKIMNKAYKKGLILREVL